MGSTGVLVAAGVEVAGGTGLLVRVAAAISMGVEMDRGVGV
jgi:hypothetical protein